MPSATLSGKTSDQIIQEARLHATTKLKSIGGLDKADPNNLVVVFGSLVEKGKLEEDKGDISQALSSYFTAASVIHQASLRPGFVLQLPIQQRVNALVESTRRLENKLKELERSHESHSLANGLEKGNAPPPPNFEQPAIDQGGSSIADRKRSLQNAGLMLGQSNTKSLSPDGRKSGNFGLVSNTSPSGPATSLSFGSSLPSTPRGFPVTLTHTPSPPASPPSAPPSLPKSSADSSLASINPESNTTYPTIEELEARWVLPSVPKTELGVSDRTTLGDRAETASRNKAASPLNTEVRPASTPIPNINGITGAFSIPPSPSEPPLVDPHLNAGPTSHVFSPNPPDMPVSSTIFPKDLQSYLENPRVQVLLLDIRPRELFQVQRIKAKALVCLEPIILTRENLSSSMIEQAIVLSPGSEQALFANRDKFDLIVIYDDSSETYTSSSPISSLFRAIYETEFKKTLKRPPVLLVGGFTNWAQVIGSSGIERQSSGLQSGSESISRSSLSLSEDPASEEVQRNLMSLNLTDGQSSDQPSHRSPLTTPDSVPESGAGATSLTRKHAIRTSLPPIPYGRPLNRDAEHAPPHTMSFSISIPPRIQYPQTAMSLAGSHPGYQQPAESTSAPTLPPQASINQFPLTRRRSDYVDQMQQPYSGSLTRPSIDYPPLIRPPPAVASPPLERTRYGPVPVLSPPTGLPKPPTIQSDYPVSFWPEIEVATSGLKNLGNTCYMNATLQCLAATFPFARFFTEGRWKTAVNMLNPLGTKGNLAQAFSTILREMWHRDQLYLTPYQFRKSICTFAPQFGGSDQHDSQEFLSFLLDGLHEDLNRIIAKPSLPASAEREAELEILPQQVASEQEWRIYRMRNDSIVVDYFQGQFRNRMQCSTCGKTSTTYNTFMYLSLPIPATGRTHSRVTLQQCLDAFVREEVLEKTDAWNCPNCKQLRRATKKLSLSRLPPVLLIHLKRFSIKGHFTDKLETAVDFPLTGLDLTNYLPPPLPPGADKTQLYGQQSTPSLDDPRAQVPPYKYDLYGVTNHFGSLSSGHYTAFIASHGQWKNCDDSKVTKVDKNEVVAKSAYILFYKRIPH